jgi:hypothetical protein
MPGPDDERPVFFMHVQKAAGLNLVLRLEALYGPRRFYPSEAHGDVWDDDVHTSIPRLRRRWATAPRPEVVAGHFPYAITELLEGDFRVLTVLRDPVERVLSYLRYRARFAERSAAGRRDQGRSLEQLYDDRFLYHSAIHNHMVRMCALTPREIRRTGMLHPVWRFSAARLARAKEHLESMELVGLVEHYDEFWTTAGEQFGWDLGAMPHDNRTEPAEVPPGLRERIAEDNAMDVELYDFATRLHARRRAS